MFRRIGSRPDASPTLTSDAAKDERRDDQDVHKGATEDERPSATTNAPGLDDDGLPNDETAIAQDALGAREDGTQG